MERGSVYVAPARLGQGVLGKTQPVSYPRPSSAILPCRPNGVHNGMGYCVGEGLRDAPRKMGINCCTHRRWQRDSIKGQTLAASTQALSGREASW